MARLFPWGTTLGRYEILKHLATGGMAEVLLVATGGSRPTTPADLRGSGAPASTIACVVAALGGVRTESAPDVGDAEVVVNIAFQAKP